MRCLLDTNVLIDAFAGDPAAVKVLTEMRSSAPEWVGFSSITRLEVLGFAGLSPEDEAGLSKLLSEFNEMPVTSEVIDEAIRIRKAIRIKTPDAIIAATALVRRSSLFTRNVTDFKRVPGLVVTAVRL